jgi:hypothetical protein
LPAQEFSAVHSAFFKGSLEQTAAFAYNFYDADASGSINSKEVAASIELLPVGSGTERNLLALLAFYHGEKDVFFFDDYLQHVQAYRMHWSAVSARAKLAPSSL